MATKSLLNELKKQGIQPGGSIDTQQQQESPIQNHGGTLLEKLQGVQPNSQNFAQPTQIRNSSFIENILNTNPVSRGLESAGVGIGNIGIGGFKGALSTASTVSTLLGKLTGIKPVGIDEQFRQSLQPKGLAQKIGFNLEQIGEYLVPIPGASGAKLLAASGAKLLAATRAGQAAKLARPLMEGIDLGLRGLIQTGSIEEAKKSGLTGVAFGGLGEVITPLAQKAFPAISRALEKTNLRLTPVQKTKLGEKVNEAADYIVKNKISGTPAQRVEKINIKYDQAENDIQKLLNQTAKDRSVSNKELVTQLNSLKSQYKNERDVLAIEKQIDDVIKLVRTRYPKDIPVSSLNELKRSTFKNAFNQAGDKVSDDVEFAIADVLKNGIEDSTKGLKVQGKSVADFNREYGTIIQARKLLKIAEGRKEVGLLGNLVALGIGSSLGRALGGPVGSAIGLAGGQTVAKGVAGTLPRSLLSQGIEKLGSVNLGKAFSTAARVTAPVTTSIRRMLFPDR